MNQFQWLIVFTICWLNCTKEVFIVYLICIDQPNINKLLTLNGIEMIIGDIVQIDKTMTDVTAFSFWRGDDLLNIDKLSTCLPNLR